MTKLPIYEKRCPGRRARAFAQVTIASECADCLRRTDLPEHMTGPQLDPVPYSTPLYAGYCANRVTADDGEPVT